MDAVLRERLRAFKEMPFVPNEAVELVRSELEDLDVEGVLGDDQAGFFISHMINAIVRLMQGDLSVTAPDPEVLRVVEDADPGARKRADLFEKKVQGRLGVSFPEAELNFIVMHFATLRNHLAKELR